MPRTSLDQLNAFVAVAQHGSFSQAARVLRKDRATLHSQVGDLEIDWGVTLFDRSGRSPSLTAEGHSLLSQARHILYQLNALENACDAIAQGHEHELTVHHDMSIPCEMIRSLDAQVRDAFPHTQLNWLHRSREESAAALLRKEADLAVMLTAGQVVPTEGLSFTNLGYPRFAFFAYKDAPLAQQQSVSLADLERHRQYLAENFADILKTPLAMSAQTVRVSNTDVLLALLKNGGYALLPYHLLDAEPYRDQYRPLPLDFMVQDGRVGYVLLSLSRSGGPAKAFLQQRIEEAFRTMC
ncbi:LysR family transcriptional regulator [Ferrimonas marina]|uniref:DNA-binding transcriptional regulator, LysR family n=1 Tax=Ferrimonas marina TaxID=299255 RepID=A0A1M5S065_9GAMM|nr:LysR family transcriptional regulator [Ferrimonas marina]SHH31859.1 DNA-binding transcriptional regulator, LysR family [Ferrimonas marina]